MILIRSFLELNIALYHISKIKRAFYLTMVTPLFLRRNACVRKTIWMLRPLRYHINKVYVWLICWGPYWFDLYGNPTDQNSIIKTIKVRREADNQWLWRALKSVVCYCFRLKSFDGTTNGLSFISIRFIEYRQHTFNLITGSSQSMQPVDNAGGTDIFIKFLSLYKLRGGFSSLI